MTDKNFKPGDFAIIYDGYPGPAPYPHLVLSVDGDSLTLWSLCGNFERTHDAAKVYPAAGKIGDGELAELEQEKQRRGL